MLPAMCFTIKAIEFDSSSRTREQLPIAQLRHGSFGQVLVIAEHRQRILQVRACKFERHADIFALLAAGTNIATAGISQAIKFGRKITLRPFTLEVTTASAFPTENDVYTHTMSRRGFLGASGALPPPRLWCAPRAAIAETAAQLPPAIAALPVLSGLARPFTNAERLARIERAQQLMAAAKIDAIVLANITTSSVYFAEHAPQRRRAALGAGHSRESQALSRLPCV